METTAEKIDRFCDNFLGHVTTAERELSELGEQGVYARMILCTMLDTLSKVSFPSMSAVGERYVHFVIQAADWACAERVSLIHMARALSSEESSFAPVRDWVKGLLEKRLPVGANRTIIAHETQILVPIECDPTVPEVRKHWPTRKGASRATSGGITPERLTHARLLYQYRNRLVHDFRVPGEGWDLNVTSPSYQLMSVGDGSFDLLERRWELVYPLYWLAVVCRQCINWLRTRLHTERRNPFDSFRWGSYWLDVLN